MPDGVVSTSLRGRPSGERPCAIHPASRRGGLGPWGLGSCQTCTDREGTAERTPCSAAATSAEKAPCCAVAKVTKRACTTHRRQMHAPSPAERMQLLLVLLPDGGQRGRLAVARSGSSAAAVPADERARAAEAGGGLHPAAACRRTAAGGAVAAAAAAGGAGAARVGAGGGPVLGAAFPGVCGKHCWQQLCSPPGGRQGVVGAPGAGLHPLTVL